MKNSKKRFAFFKGRVALHAILKAAGIGPGDQVLLPGYTCVVVPNAIIFRGAKPVYLDVAPLTFNLDPNLLEEKLRNSPRGTFKAVIVQHTYGIPCDMDDINQIARHYNLLVIEDSCHAIGSLYNGIPVGSFGDAAFFSSQWSKPITTGLGGWAEINNSELLEKMTKIVPEYHAPSWAETHFLNLQFMIYKLVYQPQYFWMIQAAYRKLGKLGLVIGSSTVRELSCEEPTNFKKTMGRVQQHQLEKMLNNLSPILESRRRHASIIESKLKETEFNTVNLSPKVEPVFLRYPVLVGNKDSVLANARKHRVQLGDWFLSPVHPNMVDWKLAGYSKGQCPIAEDLSKKTINISTDEKSSAQEIQRTIKFLKDHATPSIAKMPLAETGR